jgi:hypothetical protein
LDEAAGSEDARPFAVEFLCAQELRAGVEDPEGSRSVH